MGLCKTSNVAIFTFIIASDLKFCPRSYSCYVYHMMRFKGSNGKICKMMTSHFGTLYLSIQSKKNGWNYSYSYSLPCLVPSRSSSFPSTLAHASHSCPAFSRRASRTGEEETVEEAVPCLKYLNSWRTFITESRIMQR